MQLYTIGHSAHPVQNLINLLKMHSIQLLVDVRSVPASRWHPQYNKKALHRVLNKSQIDYIFSGQQLGGRPKDPTCYELEALAEKGNRHPRANFQEVMQRDWFMEGIEDLVKQLNKTRTVILCSEEDPQRCHRHALIAKFLRGVHPGIEVLHIRGDGTLMSAVEIFESSVKDSPKQLSLN